MGLSLQSIIAMHKDIFIVEYHHVVSLTVEPGGLDRANITLGSDMKVEVSAPHTAIQDIRERVESELASKVSFRG